MSAHGTAPPQRRRPDTQAGATTDPSEIIPEPTARTRRFTASQAVSWWSVHEFVGPVLERVESFPLVGTPAWCALPGDHPAKIAALFDAAQHWALRLETCQEAQCEASQAISAAADWRAIANEMRRRRGAYIRWAVTA